MFQYWNMEDLTPSVNRHAARATNRCLTGCGIGEVLGLVLATWWGWGDAAGRRSSSTAR
jgi:hypothetical protein